MALIDIPQISFGGGEVSPQIYERIDLQKHDSACKRMTNFFVHAEGGASNRAGTRFINEVKDSTKAVRLIEFSFNESQAYILEFGDQYMRVYKDGGVVLSGGVPYELALPYLEAELSKIKFRQSNDVMYLAHPNHAPRKLGRTDHDNWTIDVITFAPKQAAPTGVTVTPQGTAGSTTWKYQVTAVSEETLEESVVALGETATGNSELSDTDYNEITWTAAAGAEKYNIYKEDNGLYGYIGSTEELKFDDKNIQAELGDTPPKQRDPFDAADKYPGAVGLHEQRTVWGRTNTDPLTTEMSQSGQFENMNTSTPTKDDDSVSFRIVSGEGNEIRHYRSFSNRLFIFTSGAVWSVRPGGDVDAITPSSKKVSVEEYLSCTNIPPITIKNNILMVSGKQDTGYEVHFLGYNFERDGYAGSDLTILSRHLFQNRSIVDWAYANAPYRLIVCAMDDGKIVVITYLQEHQVYACTPWETDGEVESVAAISEGLEDSVYMVVKRNVNGSDVRYIEKLESRRFTTIEDAFFVDSGLTYEGAPVSTVSGLDHLEGKEVIALADGNLIEGLTVSSGSVSFASSYSKIHVGLPYSGLIETLPISAQNGQGRYQHKSVPKVYCSVLDTRGCFYGTNENNLSALRARENEAWGEPASVRSETIELSIASSYSIDNSIVLKSTPGLPVTVLSIDARTQFS